MDDWRWLKREKLWVGKVQMKAGEMKPVVETVEKVEPKNADRKEKKEKLAGGGGAVIYEVQPTVCSCSSSCWC